MKTRKWIPTLIPIFGVVCLVVVLLLILQGLLVESIGGIAVVSLLLLFVEIIRSIKLPGKINVIMNIDDLDFQRKGLVDLNDGSKKSSMFIYNDGEMPARAVQLRFIPHPSPNITRKVRADGIKRIGNNEADVIFATLLANITEDMETFREATLNPKEKEKWRDFARLMIVENILWTLFRRPIEIEVGDLSNKSETKCIEIPYEKVALFWELPSDKLSDDGREIVATVEARYLDKDEVVTREYKRNPIKIIWKLDRTKVFGPIIVEAIRQFKASQEKQETKKELVDNNCFHFRIKMGKLREEFGRYLHFKAYWSIRHVFYR